MQPTPQQEPLAMIAYRVDSVEKDVAQVKMQLNLYETTRENDLKLQQGEMKIQTVISAIADIKLELSKIKDELSEIKRGMVSQDKSSTERDAAISKSLTDVQIRILVWVAVWFLGIVAALFIGYANHIFH